MLRYEKGRRLPFDLLADVGTDLDAEPAAPTNPLGFAEAVMHFTARQTVGQLAAAMRRFRPRRTRWSRRVRRRRVRRRGIAGAGRGFIGTGRPIGKQQELVGIKAFGARPIALA